MKRRRLRPWAKVALETVKTILFVLIGMIVMYVMFFGAVLQESEKLTPLSSEEIAEISSEKTCEGKGD